MKKLFFSLIAICLTAEASIVLAVEKPLKTGVETQNNPVTDRSWELADLLSFAQKILLTVVLPLVVVGAALYIAYQLLTARGDEEQLKKAWKSVTFAVIGVISVSLAYAIVALTSRLSI